MNNIGKRPNKMASASRAPDYVDIHGRNLNAMLSDDGMIYIPLKEILKTGYHAFPSSTFDSKLVGKSMILSEFRMYMLGAAKDYMLRNSVHCFGSDDILETIEMCRQQLLKDGVKETPKGLLGRTLLQNPVEVHQEVRSAFQQNKSGGFSRMQQNSTNKIDHHQKDSSLRGSNSSLDSPRGNVLNGESQDKSNNWKNSGTQNKFPSGLSARLNLNKNSNKNKDGYETDYKQTSSYEKIKLQRSFQMVKVVHIDKTYDKLKYWVQLVENETELVEMITKCQDFANGAPVMTPKMGELYMAMSNDDQVWYRCLVTRTTPALKVHFIDFGNDEIVKELRQLPYELRNKPAQAVRITVSTDTPKELEENEVYSMKNIKEYPDQTILVQLDLNGVHKPVKQVIEPILMERVKYSTTLVNKEIVKVIGFEDGKFYLRNKEHYSLLIQVNEKIKEMSNQILDKVVQNQLVLCKKDDEECLCRAIVRNIDGTQITVQYLDFFTKQKYPLNSLYAINKQIADFPTALIESQILKGYEPGKLNDNVTSRIRRDIENRTKFSVVLGMDFDLLYVNDQLSLSEVLFPIDLSLRAPKIAPKAVGKISPIVEKKPYEKIQMVDMPSCEAPLGTNTYLMTHLTDMSEFMLSSTDDEAVEQIAQCTCINVEDPDPYEPEDGEMVLACFEGDWYRGVVVDGEDGNFTIYFVDFGNTGMATVQEIRKFPDDLRQIPIMGISCQLNVSRSEAVNKKFMESIKQDMEYSVNILSQNAEEMCYVVEIPKFSDVLRKANLL